MDVMMSLLLVIVVLLVVVVVILYGILTAVKVGFNEVIRGLESLDRTATGQGSV